MGGQGWGYIVDMRARVSDEKPENLGRGTFEGLRRRGTGGRR